MQILVIMAAYAKWHYSRAIGSLFGLWREFSYFWFRFFSVRMLSVTFFSPWRRLGEEYPKGLQPGVWLETFFINLLMRLIGVAIKALALAAWLVLTAGTLVAGALALIVWLVLPLLILFFLIIGVHLLIIS